MNRCLSVVGLVLILSFALVLTAACRKDKKVEEQTTGETKPQPDQGRTVVASEKPPQPEPGRTAGPVAPAPVKPVTQPSGKVVAPDVYWTITLERQELTKQFLEKKLAIYQELSGNTTEAQAKVRELMERELPKQMQELWTGHGISPRDYWPDRNNPDRDKIISERNTYLQEHQEVQQKSQAISREIQQLRTQLRQYEGAPVPRGPRPGTNPEAPMRPEPPDLEPISLELYWQITIEQEGITRNYLKKMLEVYKKYEGSPEQAKPEIEALQKEQQTEFSEVWQKNNVSAGQYYGRGPDRRRINAERNQYLKEHPEISEKHQALWDEIQKLRAEMNKYSGEPPRAPRPPMDPPMPEPQPGSTGE